MVLKLTDSASEKVKLLTLTEEEAKEARAKAEELAESIAVPFKKLSNSNRFSGASPLKELAESYRKGNDLKASVPVRADYLKEIDAKLTAGGLDKAKRETICDSALSFGLLLSSLTNVYAGIALEKKIVPEEWADESTRLIDEERLIKKESGRRSLFLDEWTKTVAPHDGSFNGRQMFRDKTIEARELYTTSTIFMTDQFVFDKMEVIKPDVAGIQGRTFPESEAVQEYHYIFWFVSREFETQDKKKLRIHSDAYVIDHRIMNAMAEHGGEDMRDAILSAFASTAKLLNHDYIHSATALPSGQKDSPLYPANMPPAIRREYDATAASTENHAIDTQKTLFKNIVKQNPEIEEALRQQALNFAGHLGEWRSRMLADGVNPTETQKMVSSLAIFYLERILSQTHYSLNDPFFQKSVKGGNTVADALGAFGTNLINSGKAEPQEKSRSWVQATKRWVYERHIKKTTGPLAPLILDMADTNNFFLHEALGESVKSVYNYKKVNPAYITSRYKNALGTLADSPSHPLADMVPRHSDAQKTVLQASAEISALQARLRLDEVAGKSGLLHQAEKALSGKKGDQAASFTQACSDLHEVLKRATRATRDGMVKLRRDKDDNRLHARIVDDLPAAIDTYMQASEFFKNIRQVEALRQALGDMKTLWQEESRAGEKTGYVAHPPSR